MTKPFRATELFRVVERYEPTPVSAPAGSATAVPEQLAAAAEASVLDWDGTLRNLAGDAMLLRELAAIFLAEYPKLMAAIDAAHAGGNTAELRRAAHTLKGSAQVIGAAGVGTAAQRLADLGREGKLAPVPEARRTLAAELDRLQPLLQQAMSDAK